MAKREAKSKRKVGRPKNKYTDSQIKKIKDLASLGCQTRTIATITGIAENTLRDNFRGVLEKKRLNFDALLDKKRAKRNTTN